MKDVLEKFLAEEQEKIRRADELNSALDSVRFGIFNPRWWRIRRELHAVVRSFRLCDEDYNLVLPEIK